MICLFSVSFSAIFLQVKIENGVSGQTVSFEVTIEEEIAGLNIGPADSYAAEGLPYLINVSTALGSNVEFTWDCSSLSPFSTTNTSASLTFSTWGNQTCNVTAANAVSSLMKTITIQVNNYLNCIISNKIVIIINLTFL